jgi:hypothetical protein
MATISGHRRQTDSVAMGMRSSGVASTSPSEPKASAQHPRKLSKPRAPAFDFRCASYRRGNSRRDAPPCLTRDQSLPQARNPLSTIPASSTVKDSRKAGDWMGSEIKGAIPPLYGRGNEPPASSGSLLRFPNISPSSHRFTADSARLATVAARLRQQKPSPSPIGRVKTGY